MKWIVYLQLSPAPFAPCGSPLVSFPICWSYSSIDVNAGNHQQVFIELSFPFGPQAHSRQREKMKPWRGDSRRGEAFGYYILLWIIYLSAALWQSQHGSDPLLRSVWWYDNTRVIHILPSGVSYDRKQNQDLISISLFDQTVTLRETSIR